MTLLYASQRFLDHETGRHPERPERIRQVLRQLERTGIDSRCERPDWSPATLQQIGCVHDADYIAQVEAFSASGGGRIEEDTTLSTASYEVARFAAGAVVDAVGRVATGPDSQALCLVRPPGHHALRDGAMGFCLFNNVAVGAKHAIDQFGLERVLIVDWDVHHGNGTQASFWEDPQVAFFSVHRWPFYPGTGGSGETGSGRGLGATFNLPVEFGTSRHDYLAQVRNELETFASRFKPQLVILSAGFDAHRDDPVGSLGLETEDYQPLTEVALDIAGAYAGGKVVSVLEGGYNAGALAGSVELHLQTLLVRQS